MLRNAIISLFITLLFTTQLYAQSPKREMRAAWIATVANIDWPSKPGLPSVQQQEEFTNLLDELRDMGCNTVIVQIRPSCDALYQSSIEPWSHYLTGKQGKPPFPYYDPLKFMIKEAHKRNMEFHAWFNPFRALLDSRKNPNPSNHITHQHPNWVISYGGKSYLDPGVPEVREYVIKVICDVVKRYDIDGVHLDDYFYPYKIAGHEFGDYRSYRTYGQGQDKEDWRRNNVNLFISLLHTNISNIKPYVKLGISPFGVWRNKSKDPIEGSDTHAGQTDYDDLYADVVLWMKRGWIDYLMPQVYWSHKNHAASFDVLLPWWQAHAYGRQMYYGLGVYRMLNARRGSWVGTHELMSQLRDLRAAHADGYSFYSASCFDKLSNHIKDSIKEFNKYPAFPPVMSWLDHNAPEAPRLKAIPSAQGTLLQWHSNNPDNEELHYVVYRFVNGERINLNRTDRIIRIQYNDKEFLDTNANKFQQCTYIVTAMDRSWNESRPSNEATTELQ